MSAFAKAEDYVKRYGAVTDETQLNTLLEDASAYLTSLYIQQWGMEYTKGYHIMFDDNACAVTCAVVSRVLNVPSGMEGVSQVSQGADIYSASYTFANPTGDFYLTKADKERLGFVGGGVFSIEPMINRDHEETHDGVL